MAVENLEGRPLLATLAPIPNTTVPAYLGYQMPLQGGTANQTFTATSSNPDIKATIATGKFLKIDVTHASSGANDPAFTGTMVYQLFDDLMPLTTSRIEQLVQQGFYTGKNFHRIANNFPGPNDYIVQGGSASGNGTGSINQPGFPFASEYNQQLAFTNTKLKPNDPMSIYSIAGQLAMANAGPNTNDSQFFVTTGSPRFLDFGYNLFGQLVSGQETVVKMTQVARNGETPISPINIVKADLLDANPNGVVHIDATQAAPGETSTITVTARDPSDNSTVTRSFTVTTTTNANQQKPFLLPVNNQVVGTIKTTPTVQGQTDVFQLQAVNPNTPGTPIAYTVKGGVSSGAFTPVQNATATVDNNTGIVTVVPNAGFTGVINLVVGVRLASATDTPSSYNYQPITLTVANGTPELNLMPIAIPSTVNAVAGQPTVVQLSGNTANPNSSQTLTYTITTPPAHGAIEQFNASAGTFTYIPNASFTGTDTLQFTVRDVGAPTPNLDSLPATVTINVGGGQTGAVRQIGRVLVVTPPPRTDTVPNTINVALNGGKVVVTVNGQLDAIQPDQTALDRVVVFGTKASDQITVDPSVTLPATLDGGHGGFNTIKAGGGKTLVHVWFGKNTATGGPQSDYIVGKAGRFKVNASAGNDLVFAGVPHRAATFHYRGWRPGGQFFRFQNGVLKPVKTPKPPGHSAYDTTFPKPPTTTTP